MESTPSGTPPSEESEKATEQQDVGRLLDEAKPKIWRNRIIFSAIVALLFFGAIIGGAFGASLLFNNNAAETQYKVGLMMPFSGGSSAMGYGTSKGVQLARQQLEAGNIEVIQVDTKCDPREVTNAMNYLIEQNVIAIIGGGCSSASTAAVPIANNAQIPMVSPSASTPALSVAGDYFFRVIPSDDKQGEFLAEAIYDQGARRVAVFYTNEPYGSGINSVFRDRFEALGGEIAATVSAEPDVINLQDEMQTLADANPDTVFIAPNSVVSGTAALRIGRDVGMTGIPYYGADIFYDNTIISNAPEAVDGLTVSTFPTGSQSFKQDIAAEFQSNEQLYAASQAYDAFEAIYRAIQMGATTGEEVKDALPNVNFEGVSALIQFDENGEISYDQYKYDLFQVRNREFHLLTPEDENQ